MSLMWRISSMQWGKYKGAGTDVIKIKGVPGLPGGTSHSIIPDMIEAGTFMIAAAATKGDVTVKI